MTTCCSGHNVRYNHAVEELFLAWVAKWKDAVTLIASLLNLVVVTALTAITWVYVKATRAMVAASRDSVQTMKLQLDESREERRRPLRNMLNYYRDRTEYWSQLDLVPLSPPEIAASWNDFAMTQEHIDLVESTRSRSFTLHRMLEGQLRPSAARFSEALGDVLRGKENSDQARIQRGMTGRGMYANELLRVIEAAERELEKF